jgi:diacylglycerol kinase (ATP)
MKKLRVIINSGAGSARTREIIQAARRQLWGWDTEILLPESPEKTREYCRTVDPARHEAIVLAGGDGTFNQALPALIGCKVPVVPFPAGTANDLASELGVHADWRDMQALFDRKQYRPIDLVRINDRFFATVGGLGLGAALTSKVNDLRVRSRMFRSLWGRMKSEMYGVMAAQLIATGQCGVRRLMITADGFVKDLWVSSLIVANQGRLGGDIVVAPKAANDDGLFDVVVLALDNRFELLRSMLGAKLGQSFPGNHRFASNRLKVESLDGKPIPVFGDGELLFNAKVLDFELLPQALLVYGATKRAHLKEVKERYPV